MKGQADAIFLTVIGAAIVIAFIISFYAYNQIEGALKPVINPTNNSNTVIGKIPIETHNAFNVLGTLLVLVYFAIGIAAVIAAFFVDSSPVFYVIAVFALAIQIMVAVIMHNVFFTIVQQQSFLSSASQFPMLLTLFQYYPELSFLLSLAIVVALYIK